MTDTSELIERLQYEGSLNRSHPTPARKACAEAATALESAQREIGELREALLIAERELEGPVMDPADQTLKAIILRERAMVLGKVRAALNKQESLG